MGIWNILTPPVTLATRGSEECIQEHGVLVHDVILDEALRKGPTDKCVPTSNVALLGFPPTLSTVRLGHAGRYYTHIGLEFLWGPYITY